jgi:hypothetical protein
MRIEGLQEDQEGSRLAQGIEQLKADLSQVI